MPSHPIISKALVRTGAYRDLAEPVILTSGQLGIFYINTEKLCEDGGEFERYGDDPRRMMHHALRMMNTSDTFREVIEILAGKAYSLLENLTKSAISGGQRRDWIFSGPVANRVGLPHVCINKDGSMRTFSYDGQVELHDYELEDLRVLHVVDLITEGSSIYSADGNSGWVPELRKRGATVKDLVAVVTRLQGGEERLLKEGIAVRSFVAIDKDFLRVHSSNPDEAAAYLKDPTNWSRNYLMRHDVLALLSTFDPNGGKLDRAKKFLQRYDTDLRVSGKYEELKSAVQWTYGKSLDNIMRDGCN